MRGFTAIVAGAAVWVVVTGRVPRWKLPALRIPRPAAIAASGVGGVFAFLLALGMLGIPSAALAVGVFGCAVPLGLDRAKQRRVRATVAASWPDVLARMRTRVSAGATLVEAFVDGLEAGPPALARRGASIDEAVRFGSGFEGALTVMREELDDPVADRVLVTVAAAHRSGGRRVGEILAALAASVADELRLRAAHDAAMTEQRLTAVVALVAPWALLTLTVATNPQARASYLTARGTVIILIGAAATGLGFVLARRSARLNEPPRVFR